jgi:hypothetical protein
MEPAISRDTTRNTTYGYRWGYLSVAPSVGSMSSDRAAGTSYGDLESPAQMRADCLVAGDNLRLERVLRAARRPAPSVHYDDYPREVRKRDIAISDAAARLAGALHLHLD